jgi:hypothetical protein
LARQEHLARQELQSRAGRDFSDQEWREMQTKLKEFYSVLQEWEQRKREQGPAKAS